MQQFSLKRRIFLHAVEDVLLGLYYSSIVLARALPAPVFYALVKLFGAFLYYSRPRVRSDLRAKVSTAMPEVTDSRELDRIGRGAYCALLLNVPDFALFRRNGDRFVNGLEIAGMENLERAEAKGKGVLLSLTHMGRTALLHTVMARLEKPYTLVMWHPDTTPVPRYTMKMVMEGWMLGCDPDNLVIWVGPDYDTMGEVREALAQGKRVAVLSDVSGKRSVELFGRRAALADGIAYWAYESGTPIVPATLIREKRSFRSKVVIGQPLSYELSGDRKTDIDAIMREVACSSETMIRKAPEQWMSWFGLWQWWSEAMELDEACEKELAKL